MNTNNLTYQYRTANIVLKLIVINALIFLVVTLGAFLFGSTPAAVARWFVLPDSVGEILLQPWSLLTYSFLHFGFWHIFWNMLWLYWFGAFVLNLFSERRILTIYLLGALFGGLLYVLSYNLFPVFTEHRGYLLGASAAVRAIVIFVAAYTPQTEVRVFFFNVKVWHIGLFVVLLDLIQMPTSGNAGGLLAHLGGAGFGYLYAVQLRKGNDIGSWFERMIEGVATFFKTKKQKPFRKVHRTSKRSATASPKRESRNEQQKKVDAILDKIGKSGYDSLTKEEKDFLFKAGKDD
ncbi:MAG: rhomboid family intramembrane serine protease [Flavobacteriaceae bacterium]|nr:rhomboid family intramembrane serine protease [Flavobacteriaceae bacterium]|tara:strand:+ start:37 stop:912 length:876 start_codon:yes stop_codon:yes gene_type:complete